MVDDFSSEQRAAEMLYERPDLCVFVGKRERRGRTDVMAGSANVPWFRAVSCVGGNHADRAADIVAEYRDRQSMARMLARQAKSADALHPG
jgi:hypothetical protein